MLDIFQTGLTSIVIDLYELVKAIPGNLSDIYCTVYITSQNTAICTTTRAVVLVAPSSVPSLEHMHTHTHKHMHTHTRTHARTHAHTHTHTVTHTHTAPYQSRTHMHTQTHTHTHTHTHTCMHTHTHMLCYMSLAVFLTGKNKITAGSGI